MCKSFCCDQESLFTHSSGQFFFLSHEREICSLSSSRSGYASIPQSIWCESTFIKQTSVWVNESLHHYWDSSDQCLNQWILLPVWVNVSASQLRFIPLSFIPSVLESMNLFVMSTIRSCVVQWVSVWMSESFCHDWDWIVFHLLCQWMNQWIFRSWSGFALGLFSRSRFEPFRRVRPSCRSVGVASLSISRAIFESVNL